MTFCPSPSHQLKKYAALAVLGLLGASQILGDSIQMGPTPPQGSFPGFDVRYSFGPTTDYRSLLNKPLLTYSKVIIFQAPSNLERRMEGVGECEVVYDLPVNAVAAVLEPQDGLESYAPGVIKSRIESRSGKIVTTFQEVGASFLGIKVTYLTRNEATRDELPNGAVGIRARLIDSLDGKLFESYTSWYLAPVVLDGRQMTYIHYFMRSGLRNPFPGADTALRAFMPIQLSNTIESNLREARRRVAKR